MSLDNVEHSNALNYLLRNTQQHHVQLSLMADQKANIMIASTSILMTFAFANFKQQNLFWGFLTLFFFAFIALVLAVLAVTPRLGSKDSSGNSRRNLLFFGDFTDLTIDEYQNEMSRVMSTDQSAYEAIVTDIYSIGATLQDKKYHYLSQSYRVFLVGVLAAGSLFVLQTVLFYFT